MLPSSAPAPATTPRYQWRSGCSGYKSVLQGGPDEKKVGTLFNRRVAELQRPTYYNQFPVCFGNDPAALLRRPAKTRFTTVNPQIILFRYLGPQCCLAHVRKLFSLYISGRIFLPFCIVAKYCKENDDEYITVTKVTKYI